MIGSGPAGLMAAHVLATRGFAVTLFEKKQTLGAKLLIAGSSGLNVTHKVTEDASLEEFVAFYRGPRGHFQKILKDFSPQDWLKFIKSLGIETFLGTSRRYFVDGMKAAPLLRSWLNHLKELGVEILTRHECVDFEALQENPSRVRLSFQNGISQEFSAALFALGGGSYENHEIPLRWPGLFTRKGVAFIPFEASNVGFEVEWTQAFKTEAEGKPLKNVTLTSSKGKVTGDLMVTQYGLEGTPIYQVGEVGEVFLDLKPDLTFTSALARLVKSRENLSPMRRIKKFMKLSPAAYALLFHHAPKEIQNDLEALVKCVKKFPLHLEAKRPLAEAISSAGGVSFDELDETLMLRKYPGIYAAGEMLNWDAPTGGFLIQACVSQGHWVGTAMSERARPVLGH